MSMQMLIDKLKRTAKLSRSQADLYDPEDARGILSMLPPDHSEYIGKTRTDVPDGTVAVWLWPNGNTAVAITDLGRLAHADFMDDRWVACSHNYGNIDKATALHIIKLGESTPRLV